MAAISPKRENFATKPAWRASVSRRLAEFERNGAIAKHRGEIEILISGLLHQIAAGEG